MWAVTSDHAAARFTVPPFQCCSSRAAQCAHEAPLLHGHCQSAVLISRSAACSQLCEPSPELPPQQAEDLGAAQQAHRQENSAVRSGSLLDGMQQLRLDA